ncbi:MAG: hypothetical protein K2O00_01045 [Muribaculaceae bacterium]|nr:hypothetical protein [Muribaculaceae bacterium]
MKKGLIILMLLLLQSVTVMAQRRITPVNTAATVTQSINESKRDSVDRNRLVKMEDADGKVVLVDTVTGKEFVDSVEIEKQIPKMIYPLLNSVTVGVDLWAPLTRAFGTSYGLIGFSGHLNLHNRYLPALEIGLGNADYNPENNNYRYKTSPAPYFKLGADYNFLYNSNPDYLFFGGLRFGFSSFNYEITDVRIGGNYWNPEHTMTIPRQHANATYIEFLLGIRVMIWKQISVGWTVRLHNLMHCTTGEYGNAWYIPGMGVRGSKLDASLSVYYTLPLAKKTPPPTSELDGIPEKDPEQTVSQTDEGNPSHINTAEQ